MPKPEKMKDIVKYKGGSSQKTVLKQAATNAELQKAVEAGNEDLVSGLLAFGLAKRCVNVNAPLWPRRETLLHIAARGNMRPICVMLLEAKAEMDVEEITDGKQPLHEAAFRGSLDVVELLLDRRARVQDASFRSTSPLHWAASGGHRSVADLLLDRSAKVDAKSSDTKTPLHIAAAAGHADVVRLLAGRGAPLDEATHSGDRALHLACHHGHEAAALALLDHGAQGCLEAFAPRGRLARWIQSDLEERIREVERLMLLREEAEEVIDASCSASSEEDQRLFLSAIQGYEVLGMLESVKATKEDMARLGVPPHVTSHLPLDNEDAG